MKRGLEHVEAGRGGILRQRAGAGFWYKSANGRRITYPRTLARIDQLAIPPAWKNVWIASSPHAHIQCTGIDTAGRTQYIYHRQWREEQDSEKFDRTLAFGLALPRLRRKVTRDLKRGGQGEIRAIAAAVRLIDSCGIRVGGTPYARENGTFGATTLQRRHVSIETSDIRLRFYGKGRALWEVTLTDAELAAYLTSIPSTPRRGPALCYLEPGTSERNWHRISDVQVNRYLCDATGGEFTAKDFRTWQGTVRAARSLARASKHGDVSGKKAINQAVKDVAVWLHNTPAVARESYIDPRVIELYDRGSVANTRKSPDSAVVELLKNG